MPNTSATGGYLRRAISDPIALRDFLHDWIVGLTGLANELVRPNWQQNPPPMPGVDTDWCAFGITNIRREPGLPGQTMSADGLSVYVSTDTTLELILSFYGPASFVRVEEFRDAAYIAQNSEPLFLRSLGLQYVGDAIHVPELINDIYYDRYDLSVFIAREVTLNLEDNTLPEYSVLGLEGAEGEIITENLSVDFIVEEIVP